MPQYDAVVVGAGTFGSWIAYTLSERGHKVALIDAHGPGNNRSSSGGETRIIRMSYGADAIYTRFSLESLELWKFIFGMSGEDLFHETGALFTAPGPNQYLDDSQKVLERLNIPHERLKAGELRRRFPQFRFPAGSQGLLEPASGVLMARRAVDCVAQAAVRNGATYIEAAVNPRTVRKQIPAKNYIFACGSWMPELFPKQLANVIFPTRQEILFFGVPGGMDDYKPGRMPAWVDFKAGFYSAPDIENRGFKIGVDTHGPAIDPERAERTVSTAVIKRTRAFLAKVLPGLKDAPLVESRVCSYPNTWNGDFLIDQLTDGVWIATGGSGHGFKHGPAVGRYFADVFEGHGHIEPRFTLAAKAAQLKKSRTVY